MITEYINLGTNDFLAVYEAKISIVHIILLPMNNRQWCEALSILGICRSIIGFALFDKMFAISLPLLKSRVKTCAVTSSLGSTSNSFTNDFKSYLLVKIEDHIESFSY